MRTRGEACSRGQSPWHSACARDLLAVSHTRLDQVVILITDSGDPAWRRIGTVVLARATLNLVLLAPNLIFMQWYYAALRCPRLIGISRRRQGVQRYIHIHWRYEYCLSLAAFEHESG